MSHTPFVGSGREREGRFLAVHKNDFLSHGEGLYLRHNADQVDVSPALDNVAGSNVQTVLENLAGLIQSSGTGFISIGAADGYDGYGQGTYNVNSPSTPTFADALNAAQDDPRLENGGIILVLDGTYTITETITLRPGITLMGETSGTYLIGETTEQPLFTISHVSKHLTIGGDTGGGATESQAGSQVDEIKLHNLLIFDNLNGSDSTMITVPMVSVQRGANLVVQNCSFFGKLNDGSVVSRAKTKAAIGTTSGVSFSTRVKVQDCFFDGLKTGITFTPGNGDQDWLSVSGCKARIFGPEAVSYTAGEDCFIYASLCVLEARDNFVVAGSANMKTLVNFTNAGGGTTGIRVVVSGNYGNITSNDPYLIDNDSSTTAFPALVANNNWGIHNESAWTIVVGGADGDNPTGDLFGANAINTLITWANSLNLETTAIINPGTYTVTLSSLFSSNVANLKLIGNKKGRSYPVLQLNIASGVTDSIGNRFVVLGNHLESLYFTSSTNLASVRPGFSPTSTSAQNAAHTLTVKDCIFYNTSLNIMDPGSSSITDQLGRTAYLNIVISDCQFIQNNNFANTIGLVCPRSHLVRVERCYFTGYGYAFNIGTETYSTFSHQAHYILDQVTCDLTGGTITIQAPGSGTSNHYGVIQDTSGRVTLTNCRILADQNLGSVSPVNSSLLVLASPFDAFIKITAVGITCENCLFSGPNQTFNVSGTDYAMPCVQLVPSAQLSLDNCKFHSGGLPCQISSSYSSTSLRDSISIKNCDFQGASDAAGICLSMLDVDLEPSSISTNQTEVNISGCTFLPRVGAAGYQVQHTFVTGAAYDVHGMVQIYAKGMDCNFSNNRIVGAIYAPTTNPYTHQAGLVINTYSSDAGNATNPNSSVVANNIIRIHDNNYSSGSATNSASCSYLRSNNIIVNSNVFNFQNKATVLSSFAGCLVLDGRILNTQGDGTISNNIFNNQTTTGNVTSLSRGYISIASTSTIRGKIVHNSFGNTTIDGVSNTALVEDNSSADTIWLVEYNKNQTKTLSVRGGYGKLGVKDTANTLYVEAGVIPSVSSSSAAFQNSSTGTVLFDYNDTADDQTFIWDIPLLGLVPNGAHVLSVSVNVDVSANPSTTSIANLYYRDSTVGIANDSFTPLTTSGHTLSLAFTTNERIVSPEAAPVIWVLGRINSSSTCDFTVDEMTITYRW